MLVERIALNVIKMIKPETKLKKKVGRILKVLADFPHEKVPRVAGSITEEFPDGSIDIVAFNKIKEIVYAKEMMIAYSKELLGENVIDRDWLGRNGFVVASIVLTFEKKYACEICNDTGEVSCDEMDSDGNWQHGVGTQKCECQLDSEPDFSGATEGDR